jgi:hypothetical protein
MNEDQEQGLILIDYNIDNIHNIVNNLKKNISYILVDSYDDALNKIKNLGNNIRSYGLLFSNYENIKLPDINYEILNNNNYSKYINFSWDYEIDDIVNFNSSIKFSKPNISFFGGIFSISSEIDSSINITDGDIIINGDKIGNFIITINYLVSNILFTKKYNIVCKPVISYITNEFIIKYNDKLEITKPNINPRCEGIFYCEDFPIDPNTGIILIDNNIKSGVNLFNITFKLNNSNIIAETQIKVTVNSLITYDNNFIEIYYGDKYTSTIPINNTNIKNGKYSFSNFINQNILIDSKTGLISINNCDIGTYNLIINYDKYFTNLTLIVKPYFAYLNIKDLVYGSSSYSELPIIKSNCTDYNFEIYNNNNITINKSTGLIFFPDNLNVDQYIIQINLYQNNNLVSNINYKFSVLPNLSYSENIVDVDFNQVYQTSKAIINPLGGIFSLNSTFFSIDSNNGIITVNKGLEIGKYSLLINYSLNSVLATYVYYINVKLVIDFSSIKKNIDYASLESLGIPYVSHLGGTFSLPDDNKCIKIDKDTCEIIIKDKLEIGSYNIIVNYNFNNNNYIYYIKFNILPIIIYNTNPIVFNNINSNSELVLANPLNKTSKFYLENNDSRISINDNGKIIFDNLDVNNYNFIVIYSVNNIRSQFDYNLVVLPYIYYDTINSIPEVSPYGGNFSLIDNYLSINSSTGKIYNIDKLVAGKYNFDITYEYNNIKNKFTVNYEIIPLVKYNNNNIILEYDQYFISDQPQISENDGLFYSDFDKIIVDKKLGIINISNINVGIYKFNIFYEKNNSKTSILFSLIVKPKLTYNDNIEIDYNKIYSSELPIVSPQGGFFITQMNNKKILINNRSGIININNLDVGKYSIPVTYSLNNSFVDYEYKITVKPVITYYNNELTMDIKNKILSDIAITKPEGGIFESSINEIKILENGQLDFSNFNVIGETIFNIFYTVNNIQSKTYYKITLLPFIYISDNLIFDYEENIKIKISNKLDIVNNNNFSCVFDNNSYFIINNNIIDVGIHSLNLQYIFNNIIINKIINIQVNPVFKYNEIPLVNPKNGEFTVDSDKIIIDSDGIIKTSNLKFGKYDFNISYQVNNITVKLPYTINIKPYFYYDVNFTEIIYNTIEYSSLPIHNMTILNGKFTINNQNNNISINELSGLITFNKNINVGEYSFDINYLIDNQIISTTYNLKVNPLFSYKTNKFIIIYSKYFESEKPNILGITSDNFSFTIINNIIGIEINKKTGQINFNKDSILNVDNYTIIVSLNYENSFINTNISLIILPELYYDLNIQNINYNDNFKSSIPYTNPKNGTFKLITDDTFKLITDEQGIIKTNNLDLGNYSFKVQYHYNRIYNEIEYKINCHPVLFYNITNIEIKYTETVISNLPTVFPLGGTFKIKNCPLGITINTDGQIICNDDIAVGNYNIIILYQFNRSFTTTTFNIIIKPDVIYDDSIFEYSSIINGIEPSISYTGGIFELIERNINININKDTGILIFYNMDPTQYNILIKYSVNNVSIITFYNVIIKPLINYTYNSIINYGMPIKIKSDTSPVGGKFKMIPKNNSYLDEEGTLICDDLDIGNYLFNIEYIFNNISSKKNINFTIQTNIYYENNIKLYYGKINTINPINFNGIGLFSLIDINKEIDLNINTGVVTISNLLINSYSYKIKYNYNDVETILDLNFDILPIFYYDISTSLIKYSEYEHSIKPFVNYFDPNTFFNFSKNYDFININKNTGVIYFDNNLKIGDYILEINYIVNDIVVSTNYNVTVIPLLIYNQNKFFIKNNQKININKPLLQPNYGVLSTNNLPSNLNINNDGSIIFDKILEVGNYNFDIIYTVKDKIATTNISICVEPEIYYNCNQITKNYGTYYESELPIIKSNKLTGKFYLLDSNIGIIIDSYTGKIMFDSSLNVDNYLITIYYELNNVVVTTEFKYIVLPLISNIQVFEFNFNEPSIIPPPLVLPLGGKFTVNNNFVEYDGSINLTNLKIGKFNTVITYTFNNNSNSISYEITVKPSIKYNIEDNIIIYKSNIFSSKPILNPPNGRLIGKFITKSGQIMFDFFDIGKYDFEIQYEFMLQTCSCIVSFEIVPLFKYSQLYYEMNYNDTIFSVKPKMLPLNLNFDSKLEIDSNGIIKFSNYDVGIHILNINYGNSVQTINLKVKPLFNYEETDIIINFGEEKIIYPIIETKGGYFSSNDDDIIPNQYNGIINLSNINVINKSIIIQYELNSVVSKQTLNIKCFPTFIYSINRTVITYGNSCHSTIPIINPIGGKIICNNLSNNIFIDKNGIIYFNNPDIGNYELEIIYENILQTSTKYNLIVNPIYYYDTAETFYYGLNNFSKLPILNPPGGKFKIIDNDNFNIDNDGVIYIDYTCRISEYNIKISYEVNNISIISNYSFEIIPFIFYENQKIYYGSNQIISPILLVEEGGSFTISINNLLINDQGEISNINSLEPGKYIITVIYNKKYENKFNLIIKPSITIEDNIVKFSPESGIISYDHKLINIINNQIIQINNKIGKYNFNIDYIYNNIKTRVNLDLIINTNKLYNTSEIILYYGEYLEVRSLFTDGKYFTKNQFNNIILSNDGTININNPDVGSYKLVIEYSNNDHKINTNINIIIKPKITYSDVEINFGHYKIDPLFINPNKGTFIFKNKYKNINYTKDGTIIFSNAYPFKYEFIIDYVYNGIMETNIFNVIVKPKLLLDYDLLPLKYNIKFSTNKLIALPTGGIFKSNLPFVSFNNNLLVIDKHNSIGKFNLKIEYSINNFESVLDTIINIEPEFYYKNNQITLNYFDNLNSSSPYINPPGGRFILNYDSNIGNIKINPNSGMLNFSNIKIGEYQIKITYILNDFELDTIFNIISKPIIYYSNMLNINYTDSYSIKSTKPTFYPTNGQFSIDNDKVIIDKNGVITFNNLHVNTYDFNITYKYDNIKLITPYRLIVNPSINYSMTYINVMKNNSFKSELPIVNPSGGLFSCDNLPNGAVMNQNNGMIIIFKINETFKINNSFKINTKIPDKGSYILKVNYTVNELTSSTKLVLNIF